MRGDGAETNRVFLAGATEKFRGLLHKRNRFQLFLRTTAAARAVATFFRFLRGAEENGILAERPARGAGGPAINMRGSNCKEEFAVGARIALQSGLPELRGSLWSDAGVIGNCLPS